MDCTWDMNASLSTIIRFWTMPCHTVRVTNSTVVSWMERPGVFSVVKSWFVRTHKTDALQSNNCILLSEDAQIDTKPQLEIYADDVRCTHGATVGQLDEEAVFYLRSRGMSKERAKNLLTYAFVEVVTEGITLQPVQTQVEKLLQKRMEEDIHFVK